MTNRNMGACNTGRRNTGDWNTGAWNTGHRSTGNCNTGDYNTGDCNTGHRNTGHRNTGHWNMGNCNTGNWNTGNWNTGYCNTGDWNTGDCNTGNWNTGNWNTGYCNSITPDECLIFNKPGSRADWQRADKPRWMFVDITQWVDEASMSDKEKEAHPSYVTTGGYLKCFPSLKAAYLAAWEKASPEDREKTKRLPNFDPDVFEEVFGFNPFKQSEYAGEVVIKNGKTYKLVEID